MSSHAVRFKQVDVFTDVPFKGNPLAVVFDADALSTDTMQAIAHWTNLSETTFICQPTDPAADYLVRIFTPAYELPFAGHPTLGTAHALLESGYQSKQPGKLVQQCGIGLIDVEERGAGVRAFAAPAARLTPVDAQGVSALKDALGTDDIDVTHIVPTVVDNGAPWLMIGLATAETCLSLVPDNAQLQRIVKRYGAIGVTLYAPHPVDGPATFEVRCIVLRGNTPGYEDPVTGSANAGLARLFDAHARRSGAHYTVRQGTVLGRDGRVVVDYDDAREKIWIGGATTTVVDGLVRLA